eukprot:964763-Rhodomonas_salina.5
MACQAKERLRRLLQQLHSRGDCLGEVFTASSEAGFRYTCFQTSQLSVPSGVARKKSSAELAGISTVEKSAQREMCAAVCGMLDLRHIML